MNLDESFFIIKLNHQCFWCELMASTFTVLGPKIKAALSNILPLQHEAHISDATLAATANF